MSASKKKNTITVYDVSDNSSHSEKASKVSTKYGSKNTLNLCMKEKKGLSAEAFTLMLAIILCVLVLVEFFGVYMPYKRLEAAYAQRDEAQAKLDEKLDKLSDFDEKQKEYNKYNFNEFDTTIVDRQDILDMLEAEIFDKYKVRSFSVSGNVLSLELIGLTFAEQSVLRTSLLNYKDPNDPETDLSKKKNFISDVKISRTTYTDESGEKQLINMTITLADAYDGGAK